MNAINFIKQHGVDKAMEVVDGAAVGVTHYGANNYWRWDGKILKRRTDNGFFINSIYGISDEWVSKTVSLSDLKHRVESIYLVKERCTLERAKKYADSPYTAPEIKERLEQAIADYESIYSNDVGDDSRIENHVSPLCKVRVK